MKKINRRARQLGLINKGGTISFDNMIALLKEENILDASFPHRELKADEPLHRQNQTAKSYISERIKYVPETLMEKADFVAMECQRRLKLKDQHFTSKKMTLNHTMRCFGSKIENAVYANWIPKLCGHGGTMCYQHPFTIKTIYDVTIATAGEWVEQPNQNEEENN